jgi:TonB family protein
MVFTNADIRTLILFCAGTALSAQTLPDEAFVPVIVHRRVLSMPCEVVQSGALRAIHEELVVSLPDRPDHLLYPAALSGPFGFLEYSPTEAASPSQVDILEKARKVGFTMEPVQHYSDVPLTVRKEESHVTEECNDSGLAIKTVNSRSLPQRLTPGPKRSAPRPLFTPDPEYTTTMRKARIEGTVVLQILITKEGEVIPVKVIKSLDPDADAQAAGAVRKWRFKPALEGDEPVQISAQVSVNFHLYH